MNQIFTTTPQDAAQLLYESFYQPHVKSLANYNLVSPDYGQHNVEPIKSVFNQTLISVPANNFQLIMSMFVVYGLATYLCLLIIKPIKQTCVLMWSWLISPIMLLIYYDDKTTFKTRLKNIGFNFGVFLISVSLFLTSFHVILWMMCHLMIADVQSVFALFNPVCYAAIN